MTSTKKMISGAAIGTLLGSLAALLYPRRQEIIERIRDHSEDLNDFKEKAREYGKRFDFRRVEYRENYWKGGLIGLIVGAGAALLIAPKTGKNLRGQLTRAYNDLSERSEEVIHQFKNNSHNPFTAARTHHNGVKKKKPAIRAKKAPSK